MSLLFVKLHKRNENPDKICSQDDSIVMDEPLAKKKKRMVDVMYDKYVDPTDEKIFIVNGKQIKYIKTNCGCKNKKTQISEMCDTPYFQVDGLRVHFGQKHANGK